MRLNSSTILSILAMALVGCAVWQAEFFLGDYQIYIAKLIFINAILALSLNLIYGFTGLFSLGHAGFIAVGAYVSALCILPPEQKEMMWILEPMIWPFSELFTPFWASVLAGGVVATIFAFFIAVPVLRLQQRFQHLLRPVQRDVGQGFVFQRIHRVGSRPAIQGPPREAGHRVGKRG